MLSVAYPKLEIFCRENASSLENMSMPLNGEDELHNLASCCEWVRQGSPETKNAADPYSYLKTIEEFLGQFSEFNRQKLWKKLTQGNVTSSEFLDTISELALAVFYSANGQTVEVEKPLNPARPKGKDADVYLDLGTSGVWIDVLSIRPKVGNFFSTGVHPVKSEAEVIDMLNTRLAGKFNAKFQPSLVAGELNPPFAAIALCMLKCEEFLVSSIQFMATGRMLLGESIWQLCPRLTQYSVFTLRKAGEGDFLRPTLVAEGMHPSLRTNKP